MQIRQDDITREEELQEFLRFGKLKPEQVDVLDVFKTTQFAPEMVDKYDALFIGGSSDATVRKKGVYPFVSSGIELIRYCYENNIPTFASCFGFQLAVEALGHKVILDKQSMEMGTYAIYISQQGKQDPLFKDMDTGFIAVSGHQERAASLPDNAILLAYSELCPYHAFTFNDKPFYAFQFHPEVDKHDLIARITRYQDRYLDGDGALQDIIDNCKDTTEANLLIERFIDRILLSR